MKEVLLIIDPQNDFVDPKGSLYIPGAEKGIEEICKVIKERNPHKIIITQDTHQPYHIGHPCYWKGAILPFTKIGIEDIKSGKHEPKFLGSIGKRNLVNYFSKLPEKTHTVWPEHCIEGTWGWVFPENLVETLKDWQLKNRGKSYEVIQKGMDPNHEMYSAFTRIDRSGIGVKVNTQIRQLSRYDKVLISGFAKDVCVSWSVQDLYLSGLFKDKLVFLDACMTGLDPKAKTLEIYEECVTKEGAIWE